jgi:AcrR family transcriptional regulator
MTTADRPPRLTRKGAATRARIVETAAGLMFERGVAGTSTEDVRTASGVSNSQLYHYFADKNALVQAVIAHQTAEILAGQEPLLSSLDSVPALEAWRDLLVDVQRERQCVGGCPLGSLSTELAESNEAARVALADGFARWESPIRDGLRRMRDRRELPPGTDVDSLALGILAALQGGLLLTQAMRDVAPLRAGLDLALDHVRALTVASGAVPA